jgi:DNA helicase-4
LTDYDIYIEHFGIGRDGQTAPAVDSKKYLADMKWKINLHSEHSTTLVQTFSYEKSEGTFLTNLKKKLQEHGVNFETIDPEIGLKHFNEHNYTDKLSKLTTTFISHFKSRQITTEELKKENLSIRERKFVNLFEFIFNEYKKLQSKNECIDFDDMIIEAIKYVKNEQYVANYKYILVDEFQDVSIARADLVNALRRHRKDSIVTVVGDDWQSINRFAGGDITIIQEFENVFGDSAAINLDYTFRFNDVVSKIATNFILKNPKQINKTINTIKKNESQSMYINWYDTKESMIEQLRNTIHLLSLKNQENQEKEIKILARNKFVLPREDFHKLVEPYKDRFKFSFETVHKSKGLEADYVIVIGLASNRSGFPSRIENDPILNIVMSQSDHFEDAEERRLMYVALTRTKDKVFLLAHKHQRSCFVDELLNENKDQIFEINDKSEDFEYCEECKTGLLVKRKDSKEHWFYGCSNYPLCTSTQKRRNEKK